MLCIASVSPFFTVKGVLIPFCPHRFLSRLPSFLHPPPLMLLPTKDPETLALLHQWVPCLFRDEELRPCLPSESFWCVARRSQHPWLDRRGAPWHGPLSWQSFCGRNPLAPRQRLLCSELGWGYYSSNATEISRRGGRGRRCGERGRGLCSEKASKINGWLCISVCSKQETSLKGKERDCVSFYFLKYGLCSSGES